MLVRTLKHGLNSIFRGVAVLVVLFSAASCRLGGEAVNPLVDDGNLIFQDDFNRPNGLVTADPNWEAPGDP